MGKVVSLETSARARRAATSSQGRRAASRQRKPSKTALVLGGGGFTGAVYEIGALRALDLLSVNRSVTDFDVYVGTSAGSFVAAMTANGVSPEEMMRVLDRQAPTPFPEIALGTLLSLNLRELAGKAAAFPWRIAKLGYTLARHVGQVSALDVVLGIAEGLPSGMYSGRGIEEYVQPRARRTAGAPTTSASSSAELYITATDLDTCERVVFGADGFDDVPISTAVRASTALPMVYEPVRVGDRELVDGGLISTTNLDLAVEAGARLVVVVNPLVPYVNEARRDNPRHPRVSDMGFPQIGYQAFKLMTYRRLHEIRTMWEDRYPGVDFVLIEPDASDELMFRTSVMDYGSRVRIASHGFRSVTVKLAEDYPHLKQVAARHGIEISATRVRKVVKHFAAEPEQTARWRKILEQTTGALLRQSASRVAPPSARAERGAQRVEQAVGRGGALQRHAHVVLVADARAARHEHAAALQPHRQLAAGEAGRAQPQDVRLARRARRRGRSCSASSRRSRSAATAARRCATWPSHLLQRLERADLRRQADPQLGRDPRQQLLRAGAAERVAGAQAGEPVDLREGAEDQQARVLVEQRGRASRRDARSAVDEVGERLVEQQRDVLGQRVEQLAQRGGREVLAGRVVRVAERDHARARR